MNIRFMNIKPIVAIFATVGLASVFGASQIFARERPPENAKPLVEIITSLEQQGYSPITEISLENGVWEVEVYKGNESRELKVDPATGRIISDRQDD